MNDDQARRTKQRESFLTIFLTLIAGAGILLFLIAVSGGFFFYVLLAVVGLVLFGYLHYVLWGRSMTQSVAGEREEMEMLERNEEDGWPLGNGRPFGPR